MDIFVACMIIETEIPAGKEMSVVTLARYQLETTLPPPTIEEFDTVPRKVMEGSDRFRPRYILTDFGHQPRAEIRSLQFGMVQQMKQDETTLPIKERIHRPFNTLLPDEAITVSFKNTSEIDTKVRLVFIGEVIVGQMKDSL